MSYEIVERRTYTDFGPPPPKTWEIRKEGNTVGIIQDPKLLDIIKGALTSSVKDDLK